MKSFSSQHQRGGTILGLIIGLLVGLAVSLAVALYVTKVPIPFMNKVPQRTAEQDAAEAERNKNWDPNSGLYGKNPARPSSAPAGMPAPGITPTPSPYPTLPGPILPGREPGASSSTGAAASSAARTPRDPAAILENRTASAPVARAASGVAAASAPVIASARTSSSSSDPFTYFVQAGAYSRSEEAEQQRAKLAMLGFTARVTERDQAGRTVFRVRVGPFEKKDEAEGAKTRIDTAGVESALVRVQK